MTTQELIERLKDVAEWKQIIEQHRRKTDDPSITYVLQDGTRVHEDENVIAKLAASLSCALEDAATVAAEAAALIRTQAERVRVLEEALDGMVEWCGHRQHRSRHEGEREAIKQARAAADKIRAALTQEEQT